MTLPPAIVALEGVDGAGKTSCRGAVASLLLARGITPFEGGEFQSEIGEWLSGDVKNLTVIEKVLYFAADRSSCLERAYKSGADVVLWDRYVLSAVVYRAVDAALNEEIDGEDLLAFVHEVNRMFPEPTLTIWFRVPIEVAVTRKPGDPDFLSLVDLEYARVFDQMSAPWVEVDATGTGRAVAESVLGHIRSALDESIALS